MADNAQINVNVSGEPLVSADAPKRAPVAESPVSPRVVSAPASNPKGRGGFQKSDGRRSLRPRTRRGSREDRVRPEFDQRILNIRRVARVSAGGRRFNFSTALVIGNGRGTVGVGTGKAADTASALEKAMKSAKKHTISVPLTPGNSIPFTVEAKYSSARVVIRPAPGRGLVAGSALRDVLSLGGITDVTAKILSGSKNKLNIARAAAEALAELAHNRRPTTDNKRGGATPVVGGTSQVVS